jgi:hypothetical protein
VRHQEGDVIKGYFPQIVDEQLFERAMNGRAERFVSGRGRKGTRLSNLFSGLAKCNYCSAPIKFENKGTGPKGGQYLICEGTRRGLGCPSKRWLYKDFETSFLTFVRELDIGSILGDTIDQSSEQMLDNEIAALQAQATSTVKLMESTFELLGKGGAIDFISKKLKELELQQTEILEKIQTKLAERQQHTARRLSFQESKREIQSLLGKLFVGLLRGRSKGHR